MRSASASASLGSLTFCLCFAAWVSMALLISLTLGTNKISTPQQHLIIGNRFFNRFLLLDFFLDKPTVNCFNLSHAFAQIYIVCIKVYFRIKLFSTRNEEFKVTRKLFNRFLEDQIDGKPLLTAIACLKERFIPKQTFLY